jgi:hypothetical protein
MKLFRYNQFINEEATDVETGVEKAAQEAEKKLLQQQLQQFNSNKGKLDSLLKADAPDMEKMALKAIGKNDILPIYWSLIKSKKKALDTIDKTKKLQEKLRLEQSKLADPNTRNAASDSIKEINLEIKQLANEKKQLDTVAKTLDKQIKDKLALLKQMITIG